VFDAWAPRCNGADLIAAARKMAPLHGADDRGQLQFARASGYDPAIVNFIDRSRAERGAGGRGLHRLRAVSGVRCIRAGFRGNVVSRWCSPPARTEAPGPTLDRYARRFVGSCARRSSGWGAASAMLREVAGRKGRDVDEQIQLVRDVDGWACCAWCVRRAKGGRPGQTRTVRVRRHGRRNRRQRDKALQLCLVIRSWPGKPRGEIYTRSRL